MFPCVRTKFSVFSLSGKSKNQIPFSLCRGHPGIVQGSHTGLQDVPSRSTSTQKRHGSRWGSAFIRKLRRELAQGGVMSLPVTPGDAYEHFARKTSDNLGMDPVGH